MLFVIVWFVDKPTDVTSTLLSSNVTVISNVPVSITFVTSVQSTPIIDVEPNVSIRFFTQTNTSDFVK